MRPIHYLGVFIPVAIALELGLDVERLLAAAHASFVAGDHQLAHFGPQFLV